METTQEITLVPDGFDPHSYDLNAVSEHLTQIHPEKCSSNNVLDVAVDIDTGINVADYAVETDEFKFGETPEEKRIRITKEKFVDKRELKNMTPGQLKKNVKFLIDGNHVKPVPLRKNHTQQTIDDKEKYEFQ